MANPKGTPANLLARQGMGRPKGSKNKWTHVINAIVKAIDEKEFIKWAKQNPTRYYELLARMLPKELDLKVSDPDKILFVDRILESSNGHGKIKPKGLLKK